MSQEFANFQLELYFAGMGGQTPPFPMSYPALQEAARDVLSDEAYGYVAGGGGLEDTMRENLEAFRRWRIVPRMLTDVSTRDLSTTLCGIDLPAPVMLAPVGVLSIVHDEAEVAVARSCAQTGVPQVLSTAASSSLEDVAGALGDTPGLYQLYWPNEPEVATSLVQRAEAAGYRAIVITLDTKFMPWRPRDLESAYLPFLQGEGLANYFTDEAFTAPLDKSPQDDQPMAVLRWAGLFAKKAAVWEDLAEVRAATSLPILLKGILHPDDARLAVEHGMDGIVVSNHGGRQVDGSIGALDALPGIVDAAGNDLAIVFDSGIRTGADIVKALCLGADAVLIGRPYVWGLALGGAEGVTHVTRSLLAEFDLSVALSGARSIDELTPGLLVPQPR